jgi:AraC-like DNA-binding protein
MHILQQYFHAIGSFNSLILCLILFIGSGSAYSNKLLGTWCFLLAIYALTPLVLINSESVYSFYFLGWSLWTPATFGAFLYLYIASAITQRHMNIKDFVLFIPFLACLVINFNLLTASEEEVSQFLKHGSHIDLRRILSQIILYGHAIFFIFLSARLLVSLKEKATSNLTNFNPHIFTLLFVILVLNLCMWIFELISSLFGGVLSLLVFSDIFFIAFICSLALFHWKKPEYFHIKKIYATQHDVADENNDSGANADKATRQIVLKELEKHMMIHKLYLDSDMSLPSLAEAVGINKHLISETLNKEANKNFHRFVNEYRIERVCQLLKVKKNNVKILDIAFENGFSSKSTFNNVFKLISGTTPSQYLKEDTNKSV